MALLPGSPALDAGSNAAAAAAGLTTDQRGFSRVVNGTVDIGAFESQVTATAAANQADTEGAPGSFALGSFADADPQASSWTVDVAWGDGSSDTVLTPSAPGGLDSVGHTYAEEGTYTASVTVRDANGDAGHTAFQVAVADAALHATATPVSAVEGQPVANVQVATFTDDDPGGAAGDYTATVAWGDGQTSAGAVTANGQGGFSVTASKPAPYAALGGYAVNVTINDGGGGTATATGSAAVAESPSLVVTTLADEAHPYDGQTSLREAIAYADALGGNETVSFDPALFGTAQTMTLNGTQLPLISDPNLTIAGPGADLLTIDAQHNSRIFTINSGAAASISGLTLANGTAVFDSGGAITNSGSLALSDCTLYGNSATYNGGAIYSTFSHGGTLAVSDCTLSGNSAQNAGGAIYSTISYGGTLAVSNSTLSGNSGAYKGGGAIYSSISVAGTLAVSNSTLYGNSGGEGAGGGIYNLIYSDGTMVVTNSTLSGNSATEGGGIYNHHFGSAIQDTLANTLVAGNSASAYAPDVFDIDGATITAASSLIGDGAGCFIDNGTGGNQVGDTPSHPAVINPLLSAPGNYGGPTPTMALVPGSPALDAGSNAAAAAAGLTTDQRGFSRVVNGTVDIGAFESRGFGVTLTGGDGQSTAINTAFANPLAVTVSSPYGEPVIGGQVTFSAPASGASAILSASSVTLDAIGQASVTATANGTAGNYAVAVSAGGGWGTSASLTNLKGTPVISWSDPADITYDTALSAAQLDATASVPGTFSYAPGIGAVLNAGSDQTLSATFTPTDSSDYNSISTSVTINVNPRQLSITANNATEAEGTYLTLFGTQFTTSGLVNGDTVTSVNLTPTGGWYGSEDGTYSIVASSAVGTGLNNYTISYVAGTLTVTEPAIAATGGTLAADVTGQPPASVLVATFTHANGFESPTAFTATVNWGITGHAADPATITENGTTYFVSAVRPVLTAGTYTVTVNIGEDAASTTVTDTQTVNAAYTQTFVTSTSGVSTYGDSVTFRATVGAYSPSTATVNTGTVQFQVDGVNFGDPVNVINGLATSAATTTLSGGIIHTITATYSDGTSFNGSSGAFGQTVYQKRLLITANNATKAEGTALTFAGTEFTASGLINNDTVTSVTLSCPGTQVFAEDGAYPIAVNNAVGPQLGNYAISYAYGTLTVTEQAIVGTSATLAAVVTGQPSASVQVATFTHANGFEGPTAFAATVNWGITGHAADPATITENGTTYFVSAVRPVFTAGTYTVTVSIREDTASTTVTDTQAVNPAPTTTTVVASGGTVGLGQPVTFTAAVTVSSPGSNAAANPTGAVTFNFYNSSNVQVGTGTAPLSGTSTDTAVSTISTLPLGTYTITAQYTIGDGNFLASAQPSAAVQVVVKPATTTALTSSANPSTFGQSVTFTATVTAVAGGVTPTGAVTFFDGSNPIGTGTLNNKGVATFGPATPLAAGTHSITASYGGSNALAPSTSAALQQTVNPNTKTTLTSSANPSTFGQSVTFTATVTAVAGGVTPTGAVTFFDGSNPIGTGTLNNKGVATFSPATPLAAGTHSITASYGGSNGLAPSTSAALQQTVNVAATKTAVASSVNPSKFGQAGTFTATVTNSSNTGVVPTGNVQFVVDGKNLGGPVALDATGHATTINSLSAGSHTVTVNYTNSDGNFSDSSGSLSQTVNQAGTSTVLAASPNPSVFGQSVTFTATVSAVAPGAGTPTGGVNFYNGNPIPANLLGSVPLVNGTATFPTSKLAVGAYTITAQSVGDTNFTGSKSSGTAVVVNRATPGVTIKSYANPSVVGQSVNFNITVSPSFPGAATPTGKITITYTVGGKTTTLNPTLNTSGQVSFTTSFATQGTVAITATYNGDTSYNTATVTFNQQVNAAAAVAGALSTSTTLTSSPNVSTTTNPAVSTATPGGQMVSVLQRTTSTTSTVSGSPATAGTMVGSGKTTAPAPTGTTFQATAPGSPDPAGAGQPAADCGDGGGQSSVTSLDQFFAAFGENW
jgi:CSLREA domain-containing protein